MNDINTQELRRLAEAAIEAIRKIKQNPGDGLVYAYNIGHIRDYQKACTPAAVTAILDRLEAAEAVCRAVVGMESGEDWNNGTHAKAYRKKLIDALREWQKVRGEE